MVDRNQTSNDGDKPARTSGDRNEFRKILAPLRPIYPGLIILIILMITVMSLGTYNSFVLPHHGDRGMLVMLALMVWPGAYVFYSVFCFFLFHARNSRLLTLTFNATCVLMVVAFAVIVNRHLGEPGSLAEQLNEALYRNFLASAVIGAVSLLLLMHLSRRARPVNES